MTDRVHVDLTAMDRARPYLSRLLGSVGAALAWVVIRKWGHLLGVTELTPLWREAIEIALTGAVYAVAHRLFDSRYNQTDAARPSVAAATQASPIGSASEGVQTLAALAATGERPTADAVCPRCDVPYAICPHGLTLGLEKSGAPHSVDDAGAHDDDGEKL